MRSHTPHALAMGKRDAGSDAPAGVSLLFQRICRGMLCLTKNFIFCK